MKHIPATSSISNECCAICLLKYFAIRDAVTTLVFTNVCVEHRDKHRKRDSLALTRGKRFLTPTYDETHTLCGYNKQ
jgi:Na+-transporting NADH:ubiquinone oxidoreductase subunit NqrB